MTTESDVVCQGGPAEVEIAEAGPELVIDLWEEGDERGDGMSGKRRTREWSLEG